MAGLMKPVSAVQAMRSDRLPTGTDQPAAVPQAGKAGQRSAFAFVPNAGQTDPSVRYQASVMGGTAFFTAQEIVLALPSAEKPGSAVSARSAESARVSNTPARAHSMAHMRFEGANAAVKVSASDALPGVLNLIEGSDPAKWHLKLPNYASLSYTGLYNGINLRYEGTDSRLKGTYTVAAGADPAQIHWRYTGASSVVTATNGDLQIALPGGGALVERAPIAWQTLGGKRVDVSAQYELRADGSVGFKLGTYNKAYALTIDPTLEYSTYMGGSGVDRIYAVSTDPVSGDVFVTGESSSVEFASGTTAAFPNVFVSRLHPEADGSQSVLYTSLVGGSNADKGLAISVADGVANIAGFTYSRDFPTTTKTAYKTAYKGDADMFALSLDDAGAPSYSTYLGGIGPDVAYGIAAYGSHLYIAGSTETSFEGTSAMGGADAVVVKLDKNVVGAPGLVYVHRFGWQYNDVARAITLDSQEYAYVTGSTLTDTGDTDHMMVSNDAFQPDPGGSTDGFVAVLDPNDGYQEFGSFLGGSDLDEGLGIAVNSADSSIYVTGRTLSADFPGVQAAPKSQDAFVARIDFSSVNETGKAAVNSQFLGGTGDDQGSAIALDSTGGLYVAGTTSTADFPALNPLIDMVGKGGSNDAFVTYYTPAGTMEYSTRLGGSGDDYGQGLALAEKTTGTRVYVAGYTNSSNFPVTSLANQPVLGGSDDGFLVSLGNAHPVLDLNDANPSNGINFGPVTFTEAGSSVTGSGPVSPVNPSGLSIIDSDNPRLSYAIVRFVASQAAGDIAVAPTDGSAETLTVDLSVATSGSVTAVLAPDHSYLRLEGGPATTLADFQAVLRTLKYDNTSENPTARQRLLAFEINDGQDSSSPFAFATIDVAGSNDAPVLSLPQSGPTVAEEGTTSLSGISVADVDAGTGSIEVTVKDNSSAGTLSATGTAVTSGDGTGLLTLTGTLDEVNAALATLTFTGGLDFNGPAEIMISANDQGNSPSGEQIDTKYLTISVSQVNDAPVVPSAPASVSTAEDTPLLLDIIALGVTDAKDTTNPPATMPGAIAFVPVKSIAEKTPSANGGTLSDFDPNAGTFTYTPGTNFTGTDTFVYTVCDLGTPDSECSDQTVNVTVGDINDAPSFTSGGNVTVLEDSGAYNQPWATNIVMGPTDEAGQVPTFEITSNSNPGLFSAGPVIDGKGNLKFTPATNLNGSADINVVLHDDGGTANGGKDTSAPVTFTITVTAVNDAPSFTSGGNVTWPEDGGAYSAAWATGISAGPADEVGQTLTFTVVSNDHPEYFSAAPVLAADGTLTFTPALNAVGTATLTVHLSDDGLTANGGEDTSTPDMTFTITLGAVNDEPSFTAGSDVTVLEDSSYSVPWATNISVGPADESGQTPTFVVTANSNASLFSAGPTIAADGTLDFITAPDANGSAVITVELKDDGGTANGGDNTSAPVTFTINVTPVNDQPLFNAGADVTVAENSGPYSAAWATGVLPGPANETGQGLAFQITANTNAALFSAGPQIAADGTLSFTPALNTFGTATLTVQLHDDGGTANYGDDTSDPVIFTITVTQVNLPPSINLPGATPAVDEDTLGSVAGISISDLDAGSSIEKVTLLVPAAQGTLDVTSGTGSAVVTGSATNSVTITGTLDDINTALATLQFQGALDLNGSVAMQINVDDQSTFAGRTTDSRSLTITVNAVNDAPEASTSPAAVTAYEGVLASYDIVNDLKITDSRDTSWPGARTFPPLLSMTVKTPPMNGDIGIIDAAHLDAGKIDYTSDPDYFGPDSFVVEVCDKGTGLPDGLCFTQTVNINVVSLNDAPTFTDAGNVTVAEDSGAYTQANWAQNMSTGPADESGQTLIGFQVTGNTDPYLFAAGPAIAADGTLTFTPAPDAYGTVTITVVLKDSGGTANGGQDTSTPHSFTITVKPVNDAPSFTSGGDVTVHENSGLFSQTWAKNISAGPVNEAAQSLHFDVVNNTNPALFSIAPAVAANGILTFTPAADAIGSADITLHLVDNGPGAAPDVNTSPDQTFTITVTPAIDLGLQVSGPAQVLYGAPAIYTLTADNPAAQPATGLVFTTTLPAGLSFNAANSSGCTAVGQAVTCNLASVAGASTDTVTLAVVNVQPISTPKDYSFKVHLTADQFDPNMANNDATVNLKVLLSMVVYQNDFEDTTGPEWTSSEPGHTPSISTTPSGRKFLGEFNNESITLMLSKLPAHTQVKIEFDLYILRSWDGNETKYVAGTDTLTPSRQTGYGPDLWECVADETTLVHTSFANWPMFRQSYPGPHPDGDYLARTGALESGTLGYNFVNNKNMDSVYRMSYTLDRSDETLTLLFRDLGLQSLADEAWGLDNVRVTLIGDDPFPNKLYLPLIAR